MSDIELNKVQLRKAIKQDIARLVEIENRCFTPDKYFVYNARNFRECLSKSSRELWVATVQSDIIIGYALVLFRANSQAAHYYSGAVDPELQGKGVGKILFTSVENLARERNCQELLLEIRADNAILFDSYTKRGYRVYKQVPAHFPDNMAAIKMKGPLY